MKFASFRYDGSRNIGDNVQTLAAMNVLPRVDVFVPRDTLNTYDQDDRLILLMNAWFSHEPDNWPPSDRILPVFTSFHMTRETATSYLRHAEYFKQFEPIGCRDDGTRDMFLGVGIKAHTSHCMTLTFERRESAPRNGKTFLVDTRRIAIPKSIRQGAVRVTHKTLGEFSHPTKMTMTSELLQIYRTQAERVVTTRLHCALPCIAMGIPVIFFGNPNDYRVAGLHALGVRIYDRRRYLKSSILRPFSSVVDWNPSPPDVSAFADALRREVHEKIDRFTSN